MLPLALLLTGDAVARPRVVGASSQHHWGTQSLDQCSLILRNVQKKQCFIRQKEQRFIRQKELQVHTTYILQKEQREQKVHTTPETVPLGLTPETCVRCLFKLWRGMLGNFDLRLASDLV